MESKIPAPPKLDLAGYLGANGYELKGINDEGNPIVADSDGNESAFDLEKFKQAKKLPKNLGYVDLNTPDSPLTSISPVRIEDRAALDLRGQSALPGATKPAEDSINYLKNRFDGVELNQAGDLVVKSKGVWQKVSADFFGNSDPWEVTKQLAQGKTNGEAVKEFKKKLLGGAIVAGEVGAVSAISAMGASLGAVAGSVLPGAGTAAGAIAGGISAAAYGTAVVKDIKTVLGKAMGIDQATPEESLRENMWDTGSVLAFGVAVPAGVKVGSVFYEKTLGKLADKYSGSAKTFLTKAYGWMSNVNEDSAAAIMESSASVKKYLAISEPILKETVKLAGNKGVTLGNVEAATETLAKPKFVEALVKGVQGIKNSYKNTLNTIQNIPGMKSFKIDPNAAEFADLKLFTKLTPKEALEVHQIPGAAFNKIKTLVDELNLINTVGEGGFKNAQAYKVKLNQFFGEFVKPYQGTATGMQLELFYGKLRAPFQKQFDAGLAKGGAGKLMEEADVMWGSTVSLMNRAKNLTQKVAADSEEFARYVRGNNIRQNVDIQMLQRYGGDAANQALKAADDLIIAKDLTTMIPRGAGQFSVKGIANVIASPRSVAKTAEFINGGVRMSREAAAVTNRALQEYKTQLSQMAPAARDALLSDPQFLIQGLGQVLLAPKNQSEMANRLLEEGLKK